MVRRLSSGLEDVAAVPSRLANRPSQPCGKLVAVPLFCSGPRKGTAMVIIHYCTA